MYRDSTNARVINVDLHRRRIPDPKTETWGNRSFWGSQMWATRQREDGINGTTLSETCEGQMDRGCSARHRILLL